MLAIATGWENVGLAAEPAAFFSQAASTLVVPAGSQITLTDDYAGDVTNEGTLFADGSPTITVHGDYRQAATGVTRIDLGLPFLYPWISWGSPDHPLSGSSSSAAFLSITGKAHLAGTLDVTNLTHTWALKAGDRLPLMRFDGLDGRFTSMTGMETDDPGLFLSLQYRMPLTGDASQATGIDLVVMEKPRVIHADGTSSYLAPGSEGLGLSLVTHGFASTVDKPGNTFVAIEQAIAMKKTGWDAAVFDWSAEAALISGYSPWWTAERAYDAGDSLRMWLQSSGFSYDNFQLAAHSAGTWVVSALADGLPSVQNVEATLLDAFTPPNTRIAGVGVATVSANFDRGINVYCDDWLYYTQEYRSGLVNIDISALRSTYETLQPIASHAKPYEWYLETISRPLPATPSTVDLLGFPMAAMSGNQDARQLLQPYRGATIIVGNDGTAKIQFDGAVDSPPTRMPVPSTYAGANADLGLLRSMASSVGAGLRTTDADAQRITGGGSSVAGAGAIFALASGSPTFTDIPVFGAAAANGAGSVVTNLLGRDPTSMTLDDLYDLGFRIESAASPEQVFLWSFGVGEAPSSLVTVSFTREVRDVAAAITGSGSLSLGTGSKLLAATIQGTLQGVYGGSVTVTAGIDPFQGVYVQEEGRLDVTATASAGVTGTASIGTLVNADLTAAASLAARLGVRLDDGDGTPGERLFIGDGTFTDLLRGSGTSSLRGTLGLASVRVTGPAGLVVKGSGSYDLATGVGSFAGSANGLDSTDLATMIRRLASPLAQACGTATATFAKVPDVFGKSFSFEGNVFAFRDHIAALINDFADKIDASSTVSGMDLLDRLRKAIDAAFRVSGVESPTSSGTTVHDVSFDLDLSQRLFTTKIAVPNSFKVGGFTIDTSSIPDIDVSVSVHVQTHVRLNDSDGLQILIDAGKTRLDVAADISANIAFRGKVAKVLDFSGLLSPAYHPAFQVTFSGGEMGLAQLIGSVDVIGPSDACRYLTMPVSIKLDPVDPLPAFDYRTTFRFDLGALGSSGDSAAFTEINPGVYYKDINVSNGVGPLVYDLFKHSGGPLLEKINNAIPDDVRDVLLGTKTLGSGFGSLTVNDVIGAKLGLGYDSLLDLVPYGLAALTAIPPQVTRPATDALERILRLSALLDRAKAEWQQWGADGPTLQAAASSSTLDEAKQLGLKFPVLDNLVPSVARILTGDPSVPLVTFTYDMGDALLNALTEGMVTPQQQQMIQENRDAHGGRLVIDINTAKIKKAIVDRVVGKSDNAAKEILQFLLDKVMPIDCGLTLGLESTFSFGVDTHFLAGGSAGQRILSSLYCDTSRPLFDLQFEISVGMTYSVLTLGTAGVSFDEFGGGELSGFSLDTVHENGWKLPKKLRDTYKSTTNAVGDAINHATETVVKSVEKYGQEAIDAIIEVGNEIADTGKEWLRKALAYAPAVRFGALVGGGVTLGIRDGREPGKLRLNEAIDGEAALYATGNISAEMSATLKGFGRSKTFSTGRQMLLKFDSGRVRHDNSGGGAVLGTPTFEANHFAELVSGTLFVYGSSASDVVDVSAQAGKIAVALNGVTQTFDEAAVNGVTVSFGGQTKPQGGDIRPGLGANGGNDSFTLSGSVPSRIRVTVLGGSGNDTFTARIGDSEFGGKLTFWGGGGADQLTGGAGASSLSGEAGPDVLRAGSGYAVLDGGDDSDGLSGPSEGSGRRDAGGIMVGGNGEDVIKVGTWSTGDWILVGGRRDGVGDQSPNLLYGGVGNDLLVAGDLSWVNGVPQPTRLTGGKATMLGGEGDDAIYGSPFDDVCVGGDYANSAYSGVDQIDAGDGANLITPGNFVQADDPSILVAIDTAVAAGVGKSELAVGGDDPDTFRLGVASTEVTFRGGAESDLFEIGTGDISSITGRVSVGGGVGDRDRIVVNDGTTTAAADYLLTPTSLTSTAGVARIRAMAATRFGGLSYDSTAEFLDLQGTDGVNVFDVQPSTSTAYFIDGNLPASGFVEASKGDFLKLDTKTTFPADPRGYGLDTSGRRLTIDERGKGRWNFTAGTGHKTVSFESIERFNHVDILAVGAESGAKSSAAVQVFDAETLGPLFTIPAAATYGVGYRDGVRVATGDLDNDGLPDVAIAPGRMAAPTIKVFNGAPQKGVQATEITGLRIRAASTYGTAYNAGVSIAIGDVSGDTLNDVVIAPSRGPAVVKVFENALVAGQPFAKLGQPAARSFDAFPGQSGYIGGATVTTGDVRGLGKQQVVVGSGVGMRGNVRVFDVRLAAKGYASLLTIVDPTVPDNRGGVSVAAADLDGDGRADIVTGVGAGSGAWVRAFNGRTGRPMFGFQTGASLAATVPTRVAVRAIDGASRMAVFATWGADARQNYRIRRIDATTRTTVDQMQILPQGISGGGLNIG